jgi:hypothetical protein
MSHERRHFQQYAFYQLRNIYDATTMNEMQHDDNFPMFMLASTYSDACNGKENIPILLERPADVAAAAAPAGPRWTSKGTSAQMGCSEHERGRVSVEYHGRVCGCACITCVQPYTQTGHSGRSGCDAHDASRHKSGS